MKRLVLLALAMLVACTAQDYAPPKATAQLLVSDSLAVIPKWLDTTWKFDTTVAVDTTRRVDSTMVVAKIGTPPAPVVRDSVVCAAAKLTCTFTNLSIVPAGVAAYSYYFGDGAAAGPRSGNITHTYRAAGAYWVRFVITDSLHRSATAADSVRVGNIPVVQPPPTPPETTTTPPPTASGPLHRPWLVYSYTDFYTAYHPKDTLGFRLLAQRVDRVTNGDHVAWRAADPNVEQYQYRLFHVVLITGADTLGGTGVGTLDAWLTAHGYPIESAFLHWKDSTATKAHRITYFMKDSNGDSASALNPADPGVRAWQLSVLMDLKAHGYAGVFYDVFGRGGMAKYFSSAEGDSLWFRNALTAALVAERAASGERVTINTGSYQTAFDSITVMAAGGVHLERTNYPLGYNLTTNWPVGNWWQWIDHLVAGGAQRIEFVSNLAWYDNVPQVNGNDVSPMGREKQAEYVSYLMAKDTGDVVSFAPDNYWAESPATHWLAAWDTALGRPTGPRRMLSAGTDAAGQHYQIWTRRFEHAEIAMRVNAYPTIPKNFADSTATTVALPVAGRLLRSDGTTAPAESTLRLRAGEGVIVLTPE